VGVQEADQPVPVADAIGSAPAERLLADRLRDPAANVGGSGERGRTRVEGLLEVDGLGIAAT
jgi:hypothetical protein